ncbi:MULTISPECIES: very short patch repair endonuclease [Yersinia]|uniref:Very short patch repair endonuclease n=2 Tax=Yersinia bercovieri TaxID=634 RepID=A0A2G4U359_YERBE|nr:MULTISPECIES: DNA mismatch endonuclease Vsr [Yersinia]EEQ08058.1 Very short patch repair protein [Yersinia bercovieri ATCC 43970]MDN0102422.1 DNA mismatch endonuclease Vsr [Yersinia bercovieri]PHZ27743.1 very short patch repair endonuclease [Yersinia bercovieri]QDW31612.1 DNA mismatch endonuclease Vsr [Yersinia sp. KBS0713]QKJ06479.1 DNA mismatch endonuclease Vsr [Yersinia bercovieri ATCC 43970]
MADVHSSETRSKNMRAIRARDTAIEIKLAKILDQLGLSYLVQVSELPGKPDFIVDEYRAIIFVHGCFWHKHNCHLFKSPASHTDFWLKKIQGNVKRDDKVIKQLSDDGWKVLVVWECALRGKHKLTDNDISARVEEWICSSEVNAQIDTQGISQMISS